MNCKNPQCKQVHAVLNALLEALGVPCSKNNLSAGKAMHVSNAINKLKQEVISLKAEVALLKGATPKPEPAPEPSQNPVV